MKKFIIAIVAGIVAGSVWAYTTNSVEMSTAIYGTGKVPAIDAAAQVRCAEFTFTTASTVISNTVQLSYALPTGAKVIGYCVKTSGTAAGSNATVSIGLSGGTASSIAATLDIAANGTDTSLIAPVDAGGQTIYATYLGANPADGNVMNGTILFAVP